MATVEECEAAMHQFAEHIGGLDAETRRKTTLDRSVSCHIRDLAVTFRGQLRDGELQDVVRTDSTDAQIRLAMTSDDLVQLIDGKLNFAKAWATGRIKVEASVFDLLKLRSLL
ncbi:MAG TPA: SCP2 sterol-binding domain-containing protein [Mycobacteriales bacterium]|nr:SCP2 sterol-binding domain-containing protein [Mycobacteriales bacterium]